MVKHLLNRLEHFCDEKIEGVIPAPPSKPGSCDHAYQVGLVVAQNLGAPLFSKWCRRDSPLQQKKLNRGDRLKIKMQVDSLGVDYISQTTGLWVFVDDVVTTGSTLLRLWQLCGHPRAVGLTLASTPPRASSDGLF